MIHYIPLFLLVPILNRRLRAEDAGVSRYGWFLWMTDIAMIVTVDWRSTLLLTGWIMAFTILPTNAMLSALNGHYPTRDDRRCFQWMQNLAFRLSHDAYSFGMVYGAIRALWQVPFFIGLCVYLNSLLPLVGLLMLLQGYNYRQCQKAGEYYAAPNMGVVFGDLVVGLMIIAYFVVIGSLTGVVL